MVYDRSFQAPRAVAQETLRGGHLWVCFFFFCVRVFLVGVLVRFLLCKFDLLFLM